MTNIERKTRSILDSLNVSERKVAVYFLQNIDNIFSIPISRLAEESGVSQVTWIRFCKTIGFSGLKELKKSLFQELNASSADTGGPMEFSDIRKHSSLEQMCNTIKTLSIQAVEDTMQLMNYDTLSSVVELLVHAKSIKLFGVGASGLVAEDFANKLIRINKNVTWGQDSHTQLCYVANAGKKDVCILFSYSGTTKEILEILDAAKKSGCPTVAITKYAKSPLAASADFPLYISAPEIDYRSGAMSSRIAQLAMVDLLFTSLANKNYASVEQYLEKSSELCRHHNQ